MRERERKGDDTRSRSPLFPKKGERSGIPRQYFTRNAGPQRVQRGGERRWRSSCGSSRVEWVHQVSRRRLAGETTSETGGTSRGDGERPLVEGLRLEGLDVGARSEDGLAERVDRSADGEPENVLKPSQAGACARGRPAQMNTAMSVTGEAF